METKDETKSFDAKDVGSNKGMACLSYIGILALIPYFSAKSSKYAQWHAKQGMNLFLVWIIYVVLNTILSFIKVTGSCGTFYGIDLGNYCKVTPWWITVPMSIIGVLIGVISLIGFIYALQGKAKELPIVNKIKIIK